MMSMTDILARVEAHRDRPPKSTGRRLTVANAILLHLGDGKFVAMTGARDIVGSADALTFKLPVRSAKQGIDAVRVRLDPSDTYTMTFYATGRGGKGAVVREVSGVYADSLRTLFTGVTGLYTGL